MSEEFALFEQVDYAASVEQLHRALANDVEEARGLASLSEDRRPSREVLDLGRTRDAMELVRSESAERGTSCQEALHLHHVREYDLAHTPRRSRDAGWNRAGG